MNELLEEVGQVIDSVDSLLAASSLPVPPKMHVEGLRGGLRDIKEKLKKAYLEAGGEDHWQS